MTKRRRRIAYIADVDIVSTDMRYADPFKREGVFASLPTTRARLRSALSAMARTDAAIISAHPRAPGVSTRRRRTRFVHEMYGDRVTLSMM